MINTVIEILATLTDVLILLWFVPRFVNGFPRQKPLSLIWPALCLLFQLVADFFLPGFDLLYMLVCYGFTLAFALSLRRDAPLWCIFTAFAYIIVVMLASTMGYLLLSVLIDDADLFLQGSNSWLRIVYILMCKLWHLAFYRLLLYIFKKDRFLDFKNAALSFLFTLTTAIGLGTVIKMTTLYEMAGMDIPVLILAVVLIVLNIILYLMINQVQRLMQSKYNLTLMQERMALEKARIDDAAAIWQNIRRVKHDLKNHFTVIRGKLEEGDVATCRDYLAELSQTVETMGDIIRSGNSVIDHLINSKLSGLNGVQVLVSGYVGSYRDIEDTDLASILGNILDNAIEAQKDVKTEKRIELHFLQKNANRIILCKNTIAASVLQNNKQLKSTKASPEMRGLGHQIVESKIQKYHGMLDYFEEGEMFGVQILLPEASDRNTAD